MKETIKNLTMAFVGESQARNRYDLYAKIAKKEGYVQIAKIFEETALQEKQHAKWFFNMLQEVKKDEGLDINMIDVPTSTASRYGDTLTNLKTAIEGENEEYSELYPKFAKVAEEEGYLEFAKRIRAIMVSEMHHEERFKKLYEQVKAETVFKKEEEIERVCMECGYVHKGKNAPELCPSCDHPTGHYIRKCEEY
ncbi:MAG TPA: ferritin family protein [Candidatus Absconditabacterales bacterium]|nr:ferritin family protein [Candidatus Absconditabacterales bacterium]